MNALDQVVIALWFLPVVLFIIIPLCITCLWGVLSLLNIVRPVAGQQRVGIVVRGASTA